MTSLTNITNNEFKLLSFKLHNITVQLPESFVQKNLPWLSKQFGGNGFNITNSIGDISYYIPEDYWHIAQYIVDLEEIILPIKNKKPNTFTYPEWKKNLISQQALYFLKNGPEGTDYPRYLKWKCIKCLIITNDINSPELYYPHDFYEASDKVLCKNCGVFWKNIYNYTRDDRELILPKPKPIYCGCNHKWREIYSNFKN